MTSFTYSGTRPFADAEWKDDPTMCQWCAGTGHPLGDPDNGLCHCPDTIAAAKRELALAKHRAATRGNGISHREVQRRRGVCVCEGHGENGNPACLATLHLADELLDDFGFSGYDAETTLAMQREAQDNLYLEDLARFEATDDWMQEEAVRDAGSSDRRKLLTARRRGELAGLLTRMGLTIDDPRVQTRLTAKIAEKGGDELRGVCAALYETKKRLGIETPMPTRPKFEKTGAELLASIWSR